MWPFRRGEPSRTWQKRLADVEEAIEDGRRRLRALDLDLSDALEKFQRLSARMAKRAATVVPQERDPSPLPGDTLGAAVDPISAKIIARRRAGKPAPLVDDGILPER